MNNDLSLSDIKKDTEELNKNITALNSLLDKLKNSQKELSKNLQQTTKDFTANAESIKTNKAAIHDLNEQIEQTARVIKTSSNSLSYNKELMNNLLTKYETLQQTHANNSRAVRDLKLEIVNLSMVINNQENELKNSTKAFDFHTKSIDVLKSSFETIKDSAGEFAPALESVTKGFNVMEDGLKVVKTGFQGVGSAIKATGFGLLVLVLQSVTDWLTKTKEGNKYLAGGLAAIGTVVKKVEDAFTSLGGSIFKAIIHPVDTINKVWDAVSSTFMKQVKPFLTILDGIVNLDFKQVKQGFNQLTTNVNNTVQGVVNTFKKAKNGIIAFAGEIGSSFKEAYKNSGQVKKVAPSKSASPKAPTPVDNGNKEAEEELLASRARMSAALLQGFAKEIADTESHFQKLKDKYKGHNKTVEQLEKERIAALNAINKKFRDEDSKKLDEYHKELRYIGMTARQQAQTQLTDEYNKKKAELEKIKQKNDELLLDASVQLMQLEGQPLTETLKLQIESLKKQQADAQKIYNDATGLLDELKTKHGNDSNALNKDFNQKTSQENQAKTETELQGSIDTERGAGHEGAAIQKELDLLKLRHDAAVNAATAKGEATTAIDTKYAKQKADLEDKLTASRIHAGDKLIDAVLKNSKKDSAIFKAAFLAKKATSIADTIISTKQSVMESLKAYSGIPFIGQALGIAQAAFMAVQGATSIAEIAKQKPGFAQGGQYTSDGRGALLPGYSRTDNTNAYLRSGEAVVVSEAMRNPWARNLVSAINVAYGGRDFSVPNLSHRYAIGGIFTDGGNASRYYSQPMNDQKELANTLAYQMLNNFPPIYVDVKDVNNQQNILAQTVNRVNL